jgi:hypothetical protein
VTGFLYVRILEGAAWPVNTVHRSFSNKNILHITYFNFTTGNIWYWPQSAIVLKLNWLLLSNMGKYAAHDVVRITNSIKLRLFYLPPCLMQREEGKTVYVLFRHRHLKPTLRLVIRFNTPGYTATATVTRHAARQKSHVFQELYMHLLWLNRNVRKILFATPSWPSAPCAYDVLSTYGISSKQRWVVSLTEIM